MKFLMRISTIIAVVFTTESQNFDLSKFVSISMYFQHQNINAISIRLNFNVLKKFSTDESQFLGVILMF